MYEFCYHDLLRRNLGVRDTAIALVTGTDQLTYGELGQRVEALAAWLHGKGIRRGDRVVVNLFKSIEEVVAIFAVSRIGAVFVDIHYQWTMPQLAYVLADCGAKAAIVDERRAKEMASAGMLPAGLEIVLGRGKAPGDARFHSWDDVPSRGAPPAFRGLDVDLAAILYTSGSTGKPKGVMLSHLNLLQGARSVAEYVGNTSADRVLSVLPFSFDYGLNQLNTMFLVGGTLVLQPVVMPAEIVRAIQRHDVTGMAAVPPLWNQLVRHLLAAPAAVPTLRYVTNSGGKIPQEILRAMPRVFPGTRIFLMYGLTEAFRSTYLAPELFATKMGAIGKAIPGAEVYLIHERGICGPGEQGELVHRGSLISMGYWGNPDATAAKIRPCPQLRHLIGDEKVVYSGDLVRMDEDGVLWFVNRMDTMIKCSGFRISPTEVEDVLHGSGRVASAVAFGVADDMMGQVVEVAVSWVGDGAGDIDGLLAHCRKEMPQYMVPRRIHVWTGNMPRTGSGKIDVPAVVKACIEGLLPMDRGTGHK